MSPFRVLLREIHRRNVWRNAGLFIGGGWGVLQVVDLFIERGFAPEWVFGGALVALALCLPVVVVTSWVQGGGSEWGDEQPGPGEGPSDLARVFTWRRTAVAGVLAFALLGFATAVFMVMRVTGIGMPGTLQAQGVLSEGGRIVLADFESSAGEAAPGDLVTETLRIDLGQSTAFSLVSPATVRETLALMRREVSDGVPESVAREVAVRNGVGAVVSGEIGRLGSGFVINARVVAAESGEVLSPFRVTADSDQELIGAIDEISHRMRSKIGESLRSVAESESLPEVTTTSLEALRAYTMASSRVERGVMDPQTAQRLLLDAVRLDSTFATAYRSLAITISNYGGDRETQAWAATQAYRHRERLTEIERLSSEAYYYKSVLGDQPRASQAYRSIMERYPDRNAHVNLADSEMYEGRYDEALRALRTLPRWESAAWTFNYTVSLSGAGLFAEALASRDSAAAARPDDPYTAAVRALLLAVWERPDEARAVLAAAPEPTGAPRATQWLTESLIDALEGRLEDATADVARSVEAWGTLGEVGLQVLNGLEAPLVVAILGGDPEGASDGLDRFLAQVDWTSMSRVDRALPFVAFVRAVIGQSGEARRVLDVYETGQSPYPMPEDEAMAGIAAALSEVNDRGATALPELEAAVVRYRCARCRDLILGLAYERGGRGADAIEPYERYLEHRFFEGADPLTFFFTAYVRERLGALHDAAGDVDEAIEHFAVFEELWADADPALQPRVRHARERLLALRGGS